MEAPASRHRHGWADRIGTMSKLPLLVATALACLALVAPLGRSGLGTGVAAAMGPLPDCRYDSILTTPRLYVDWRVTLVDTILRVPSTYAPPDLVPVGQAGLKGVGLVRSVAVEDLKAMADAARAAGSPIAVASAYRSYSMQKATFQYWVDRLGYRKALRVSARPGHSEHQLGLAIDFRSEPGGAPWNGVDWATTPAGKWMKANAWTFGWILSYPKGAFGTVCYDYEPWHWRYVGRELAAKIHASGLTTRAYLWANFTTAFVGPPAGPSASGLPAASGSPEPSASVEPSSEPTPTLEPSPSPAPPETTATPTAAPTADPGFVRPVGFLDTPEEVAMAVGGLGLLVLVVALAVFLTRSRRRGTR
jgi:LAS superfamily LD-carboxypeptidase LdcB